MNQCKLQTHDRIEITDYHWRVRKVSNWRGGMEYVIELLDREECVGFGRTMREARCDLHEAIRLNQLRHGQKWLPEAIMGAQMIVLEPPMTVAEELWINTTLQQLKEM